MQKFFNETLENREKLRLLGMRKKFEGGRVLKVKSTYFLSLILSLFLVALHLFLPVAVPKTWAAEAEAKTPPPAADFSVRTIFDPNYSYLERGQGYLTYEGDEQVNILGETFGTIRTDKIGVKLTLQRWTGSTWVDVYYGASVEETNAAYAYLSISNVPVESGYYYRTESYHWIQEGGVSNPATGILPPI